MTPNIAYLAALLKPRDIAVHGNFASEESVETPSALALLALGDFHRFNLLTRPDPFSPSDSDPPWRPTTEVESDLLDLTQSAMTIGKQWDGAAGLRDICTGQLLSDLAATTAAALIASLAFAESDDYESSLSVLDSALSQLTVNAPAESLCKAALLVQRSLRISDSGQGDGIAEAHLAHNLLRDLDPGRVAHFRVSLAVEWSSPKTVADMKAYLLDSCMDALTVPTAQVPTDDGRLRYSWQDRVRAEPDHVSLLNDSRLASGYERFIAAMFRQQTRGTSSREMRFGEVDRGQGHLFAAQFADEISGHRRARSSRRALAEYRLLVERSGGVSADVFADVIRLLRHSGSPESLKAVLNVARAEGPLAGLASDARTICARRLHVSLLREPELRVLHVAADLLPEDLASDALRAVLTALSAGVPARVPGRWSSRAARLEPALLAAGALASSCGGSGLVAERFLQFVREQDDDDELLDRAVARSMRELDWNSVATEVKDAWTGWALDGGQTHDIVREQSLVSTGSNRPAVTDSSSPTLGDIAQVLNIKIRGGSFPANWLRPAVALVRRQMKSVAADAEAGRFSGGGIVAADVAVGLALYAGGDELWPDIARFVTNPSIARADTTDALDRMAREAAKVPSSVVASLGDSKELLMFSTKDVFGESINPYPAAVRCLARTGIISSDELLILCDRLAGDGGPTGRHESARVVTMACRDADPPAWLRVSALHQSWDSLPEVRAEAARALALLSLTPSGAPKLFEDRLIALIGEDGLLVPTLALRGLADLGVDLGSRVLASVSELAQTHPSRSVRRMAGSLVS